MAGIVKRSDSKSAQRARRHTRVRKRIVGTEERPRLVVTRSARHVFVQVVDDSALRAGCWWLWRRCVTLLIARSSAVDAVLFELSESRRG